MIRVAVVGAGVFGAATARELHRRGHDVTLYEQYTPGTVRSASGGDTRLIRAAHGENEWYAQLSRRALELWRELEAETSTHLLERTGVAWLDTVGSTFADASAITLDRLGVPFERLSVEEARRLFPSLGGDDLVGVLFEPDAGLIRARRATRALAASVPLTIGHVTPEAAPNADVVIWAGGAWLPKAFPGLLGIEVVRRDVYFFGVDGAWARTPGFCEYDGPFYGHGELGGLGMKVAWDGGSTEIDPDGERLPENATLARVREYIARRFPTIADAPLIGSRVCQYELTGDGHFLVDRHPERSDWWLLGGASGHGFKHGPALAEYVADCVEGLRDPEPFHSLGPREGSAGLRTAGK
jgi:glycine/D-amino acid oxidase-like deaminating enzyme